jgi:hypothetical protein
MRWPTNLPVNRQRNQLMFCILVPLESSKSDWGWVCLVKEQLQQISGEFKHSNYSVESVKTPVSSDPSLHIGMFSTWLESRLHRNRSCHRYNPYNIDYDNHLSVYGDGLRISGSVQIIDMQTETLWQLLETFQSNFVHIVDESVSLRLIWKLKS